VAELARSGLGLKHSWWDSVLTNGYWFQCAWQEEMEEEIVDGKQ